MTETLEQRFNNLNSDRTCALNRKRTHSAYSIPSLLPPEGKAQSQALEVPYDSITAEGVNSLASKIAGVVLPLNSQTVFELDVEQEVDPAGEDMTEMRALFGRIERATMRGIAPTNLRPSIYLAYKHLIAIGDCLLYSSPELQFRVYRLDQYVVRWKTDDQWSELVVKEMIDPELYPELVSKANKERAKVNSVETSVTVKHEPLYTRVERQTDGTYTMKQEFRGIEVNSDTYKVCPWFPLRWNVVAGEDYATSLVEDAFGDIRAVDSLQKALIDGTLLNAEYRWGVNPAGLTEMQDMLDSVNGDYVPAVNGDVFPLQFQNAAQVGMAQQAVSYREQVIGRRFLMNSAIQPQGERVTARQVSILAQELESGLGGLLSQASRDLLIPVIRYVLYRMAQKRNLPEGFDKFLNDGSILKIRVRAGLEILNREAEREKIDAAIERMRNLPPEASKAFIWPAIARDWWESMGLDPNGRVKTMEQLAQEQAAEMEQQKAAMLQQGAVQAGVAVARQAAQQPQPQ